jgi:hypothetical protein
MKIMDYYEEIKRTTPEEVVQIASTTSFDASLGFDPDLGFVPYTQE